MRATSHIHSHIRQNSDNPK